MLVHLLCRGVGVVRFEKMGCPQIDSSVLSTAMSWESTLGADAILLACTEIGLLVGSGDSPVPVYDTAELHARAAVELALGQRP